ncbi:MAG TPA: choice-of-anchor tandem repeat GloVer-containing protein [Alphaproteobacteria bacterium]|jgi:uncharacterized repeat protein (TIGR03803 family)|nr:choice-of-anchor tandem repeat GloVer-containing protein [Alphaproteobacteria bacterium]
MKTSAFFWVATAAILFNYSGSARAADHEKVLIHFDGTKGLSPTGPLVVDGHGNLYGSAAGGGKTSKTCPKRDVNHDGGCGLIFELSPPAPGKTAWTETVLYEFNGADGAGPAGGLMRHSDGTLYGVTESGGGSKTCPAMPTNGVVDGCGVAFKLTPPATGKAAWTETILHRFTGAAGAFPNGSLVSDSKGNLYGATTRGGSFSSDCPTTSTVAVAGCGTAFELVKPASTQGAWTVEVLHNFGNGTDGRFPVGGMARDAAGNLYGVTQNGGLSATACQGIYFGSPTGCGIAYRLAPPAAGKTSWTETVLHQFRGAPDGAAPTGGLLLNSGKLYGVTGGGGTGTTVGATGTAGDGTFFVLSPPAAGTGGWAESVLFRFHAKPSPNTPTGALVPDGHGGFYGTTIYGGGKNVGTVYELSPPAGKAAWTTTVLHAFSFGQDGSDPNGGLTRTAAGKLFGTTVYDGTYQVGNGTVFEIVP